MIGIAVTTYNRPEILHETLENIQKFKPKNSMVLVVQDGGEDIVIRDGLCDVFVRETENRGIALTKNICISYLYALGCTEMFLFDDDTYPIKEGWHEIYINSPESHLSYTFSKTNGKDNGRGYIETINGHDMYNAPCGCMLYLTREVVEVVGGMDLNFGKWGFEHLNFSDRVYNNKLTSRRYMDIHGSGEYIFCRDQEEGSVSSDWGNRELLIKSNKQRYMNNRASKEFIDPSYRKYKGLISGSYFVTPTDPQRGLKWEPDECDLDILRYSSPSDVKIFTDTEKIDGHFVVPEEGYTPNVWRWINYSKQSFDDYEAIFFVDSTDVEVLRDPFDKIRSGFIYIGCEIGMKVNNRWMRTTQIPHVRIPDYDKFMRIYGNNLLLNCGIVGGVKEDVLEFINDLADLHQTYSKGLTASVDMATFNYLCYTKYSDKIVTGINVNTRFKYNEYNTVSMFKHK